MTSYTPDGCLLVFIALSLKLVAVAAAAMLKQLKSWVVFFFGYSAM